MRIHLGKRVAQGSARVNMEALKTAKPFVASNCYELNVKCFETLKSCDPNSRWKHQAARGAKAEKTAWIAQGVITCGLKKSRKA